MPAWDNPIHVLGLGPAPGQVETVLAPVVWKELQAPASWLGNTAGTTRHSTG